MSKVTLVLKKCDVSVLTPLSYDNNQYNKWVSLFQELQNANALQSGKK